MSRIRVILTGILLFAAAGTAANKSYSPGRHPRRDHQVPPQRGFLSNPAVRGRQVEDLGRQSILRKQEAWAEARRQGWAPRRQFGDEIVELMAIEGGRVYMYKTLDTNAAISIAVDQIRNVSPYNLSGAGLTAGIWDAGSARATHQELVGRVSVLDGADAVDHSTHVAGILAATGVIQNAMGMAPEAFLDSYDWNSDVTEMTSRAMSYPDEPGTLQVSNHSYGYSCGWETSYNPPRWFGTWSSGVRESDSFGQYDSKSAAWDQVCYNAPYYLPFKAAGNDRGDSAPDDGETFEYYFHLSWRTAVYDSSVDPYSDNWDDGGFDTLSSVSNAKNVMTVGSVNDAVTDGQRDLARGTMTSYSSWGPTDDGRIKPDIVTNGAGVYSCIAASDIGYTTWSGTSMATPGAAGAAILLIEYYGQLFPGQVMRASTIKALLIHTADDLGNPGPDYKYGWGLVNAQAAADLIKAHFDYPEFGKITEGLLDGANPADTYAFDWDGVQAIRATLCWTDPPATAVSGLDNPSPRLINDLDLRIVDPNGTIYMPFVLHLSSPADAATTGDNTADNVEQVLIAAPVLPGSYTVQVSHKGSLTNGEQYYSLILSGQFLPEPVPGDFTGNGVVDCNDLVIFSDYWLQIEPAVDLDPSEPNGLINYKDFSVFSREWLKGRP